MLLFVDSLSLGSHTDSNIQVCTLLNFLYVLEEFLIFPISKIQECLHLPRYLKYLQFSEAFFRD